jgi:hypothetical protein
MRDTNMVAPPGASAPAPSAVPVRFQFVVIVCLPRFPAFVPVASVSVPVFGSRAGLSGPSVQQPFDRVQVSENRAAPELSFRLRSRGCHAFSPACLSVSLAFASLPLGPGLVSGLAVRLALASLPLGPGLVSGLAIRLALASLPLGPAQLRTAFRRRRLRSRSTSRSRPPVLLVCCSFRSWFVSRSFV